MKIITSCLVFNLFFILKLANAVDFLKVLKVFNQNSPRIGSVCMIDFMELHRENSTILKTWSTFTSSHKYGNSHDFGDFFGCNSIKNTQYCLVQYFQASNPPIAVLPSISYYQRLWTDLDKSFLGALCLPSSCGLRDVQEILQKINQGQNLTFSEKNFCKTRKSEKFGIKLNKNNFSILNWWNLKRIGFLIVLLILASIFSMSSIKKLQILNIIKDLTTFSSPDSSTAYLNGIKALTIMSITFYHSHLNKVTMPFKDGKDLHDFTVGFFYQFIGLVMLIMDVFFFIGGFLTAMSLKKGLAAPNKFKWILKFYIKRTMRLLPVTFFIVFLFYSSSTETLAPYDLGVNGEAKLWVLPIAFNFMDYPNTYVAFIWFVPVFLQLSIMAPFVLMLTRIEKYGNYFTVFLMTAFGVVRMLHTSDYYYGHVLQTSMVQNYGNDLIFHKYIALRLRFLPFFAGVVLEKFLNCKSAQDTFYLKVASGFGAIISIPLIITGAMYFIPQLLSIADVIIVAVFISILYFGHHSDWKIKKILSHKIWELISKMGLSVYLISSYFLFTIHERQLEPQEIENELQFLGLCLLDIPKIIIAVLLTFLLIEEPLSRLGDYIANKLI